MNNVHAVNATMAREGTHEKKLYAVKVPRFAPVHEGGAEWKSDPKDIERRPVEGPEDPRVIGDEGRDQWEAPATKQPREERGAGKRARKQRRSCGQLHEDWKQWLVTKRYRNMAAEP